MATTFYRIGAAVALGAGFLQVWMNLAVGIVGGDENPANLGFFLVVAAAGACAFTARFRAEGMARAMLAAAGLQLLLAAALATAPSHAREAMGIWALSGGFGALWLVAAACFHRAQPDAGHAIA